MKLSTRSSLIYNTNARHERHDCNTSETRATRISHKCDTSATLATRVRQECYTNDTGETRVKNVDFDNETSKNIFSHAYISYIASERLQGEEQFHSLAFEKCTTKIELFHGKRYIKKTYTRL